MKGILDKGGPELLQISKGRKFEIVKVHQSKTYKYPVDTTCPNVPCLLLRHKSRLEKDAISVGPK